MWKVVGPSRPNKIQYEVKLLLGRDGPTTFYFFLIAKRCDCVAMYMTPLATIGVP